VRLLEALLLAGTVVLAPAACDHGEAWSPSEVAPTPERAGMPRRLTFNPEGDHWPVFLRDGSAIGYSYHPLDRTDRDRCLAFIPPGGGRIIRQVCQKDLHETDSVNVVSTHGVSPGGRLAMMVESGNPGIAFPDFRGMWLGRMEGGPMRLIRPFPYLNPTGQVHHSASGITWPNDSTMVYLAMYFSYSPAIQQIPADTEYTGIELVQLGLRGDSVVSQLVIPGTAGTTSLAGGPGDTVYFTRGGDSRVYALATGSGLVSTLYDFGPLGIARDVQVAGGTLAAVVGGRVRSYFRPTWGIQAQADSGGSIYTVRLPSGAPQLVVSMGAEKVPGTPVYRHIALDPQGQHLVAERMRFIARHFFAFSDTVVSKESDLWLFDVP
jgi:hypothetical protein